MTKKQKQQKREEFLAFANALPALPTTLLASLEAPRFSRDVRVAAQVLVGALDPISVYRVAKSLETLVQLNEQRPSAVDPATVDSAIVNAPIAEVEIIQGRKRRNGRG